MLNIEPIKLMRGCRPDTGTTGQGCFMNVVAYLNGESQITERSTCVCRTVRPIAIWLNDFLCDEERSAMVPYLERALGSATTSVDEMVRRALLASAMAETVLDIVRIPESASLSWSAWMTAKTLGQAHEMVGRAMSLAKLAAEFAALSKRLGGDSEITAIDSAIAVAIAVADAAANAMWIAVKNAGPAEQREAIDACFAFLDAALPRCTQADSLVMQRAHKLVQLATA